MNNDVVAQIETLKCTVISPTKNLLRFKDREETTQASSLLMHTAKCGTDKAHFVGSSPTSEIITTVRSLLIADLQRLEATDEHDGRIYKAISEILSNKKRLVSLGRNEAEIRYAICGPLMSMVCDCYSYTLKLEETVKNNLEMGEEVEDEREEAVLVALRTEDKDQSQHQSAGSGPLPSSSEGTVEEASMDMDAEEAGAGAGPSETGRRSIGGVMSDYTVYTLGRPGQKTKVVVIIDAKKRMTPHSVAQVIGYYSAFEVGDPRPLVVVLTAYELKIVIFPFHDGSQRLVNAVELQEFKLWKGEGRMLDVGVLNLLLSLMDQESLLRTYSIEAEKAKIPQEAQIPKNRVCNIVTDQAKFEEISKKNYALKRMVRQLKKQKELNQKQLKKQKELREQEKQLEKQKDLEKEVKELREQLEKQKDLEKEVKELREQLRKQKDLEKEVKELREQEKQRELEKEVKELREQLRKQKDLEKEVKELREQEKQRELKYQSKRRKANSGDTI